MTPERWSRISAIFDTAVELSPPVRAAFLAQACAEDEDLRVEVERLLAEKERTKGLPDQPAPRSPATPEKHHDGGARSQAMETALDRKLIQGRFAVRAKLGAGGMGEVYLADDTRLRRCVALKRLRPELRSDRRYRTRILQEARRASSVTDPRIAQVYDVLEEDDETFLLMEYVEGTTLRQRMGFPLPFAEFLEIAMQCAGALAAAHQKGVVHCDIKPENIMLTPAGQVKILDFGIAKRLPFDHARNTTIGGESQDLSGTPPYMAPEVLAGNRPDARSDIYSLGVTFYEALRGHRPAAMGVSMTAATSESAAVRPAVPPEVEPIVKKMSQLDPAQRYADAADLLRDLRALQESRPRGSTLMPTSARLVSRRGALAAGVILSVVVAWVALTQLRPWIHRALHPASVSALTEKDTVALADFTNKTGDPVFDDTLKQALTVALRESPFLNVLSDDRVAATLRLMERPAGTAMTDEVAREVCQRAGSRAYLAGSIAALGGQYVLGLKAVGCASGETLAEEQVTAASKEKVLRALGQLAAKLRSELGETLPSVRKFDTPLEQATTSSLEALKAYSMARKAWHEHGPAAALPSIQRAVELDPGFASAYMSLGMVYSYLGQTTRARECLTKAFALRERTSELEKLQIAALYYDSATGELGKAAQTYQQWIENYPRAASAYNDLSALRLVDGDYAGALELLQKALPLDPNWVVTYEDLGWSLILSGRLEEARKTFGEALSRKLDDDALHLGFYALAFLDGDTPGMASQAAWYAGRPEAQHEILSAEADTQAFGGHLAIARQLTRQAVEAALRTANQEAAALWRVNAALREAAFGNAAQARQETAAALKLAPDSRNVGAQAALAEAWEGDQPGALKLESDLKRRFPLDTLVNFYWLPTIDATMKLAKNSPTTALDRLETVSSPLELGVPILTGLCTCLYPAYIRGKAYLAAGEGGKAAGEFQKILDHPGIVLNCPTGALAHLNLGRAYALEAGLPIATAFSLAQQPPFRRAQTTAGPKGGTDAAAEDFRTKARAAYQEFFNLWKDADPDVPILKQAKAEYAKLR